MFDLKIKFMQHGYFQKILLKSCLPRKANQFYLNRAPPPKQGIQLLGPSSRISKPRNTMIKPINNKAYHKVPSNLSPLIKNGPLKSNQGPKA